MRSRHRKQRKWKAERDEIINVLKNVKGAASPNAHPPENQPFTRRQTELGAAFANLPENQICVKIECI